MAPLAPPFNSETTVITSLAIGLGVDDRVHPGEPVVNEKRESRDMPDDRAATDGSHEK